MDIWKGKTILDPFCHGRFGRKWDNDGATIEASGSDWVVARDTDGAVMFAVFSGSDERDKYLEAWTTSKDSPGRTSL